MWAEKHDHYLVSVMRDERVSGTREAADREGLSAALTALQDGPEGLGSCFAYALIVRRGTLGIQEAVLGKIWSMGGRAFTCDLDDVLRDDPEHPARTAMRQMLGVLTQLERGLISARLRTGRRQKHAVGGYAFGAPPYGFRSEKRALAPVPEEQIIVTRMRHLRADGMTLRAIAVQLDTEGLKPRRAERRDCSSVRRVLGRRLDAEVIAA